MCRRPVATRRPARTRNAGHLHPGSAALSGAASPPGETRATSADSRAAGHADGQVLRQIQERHLRGYNGEFRGLGNL